MLFFHVEMEMIMNLRDRKGIPNRPYDVYSMHVLCVLCTVIVRNIRNWIEGYA